MWKFLREFWRMLKTREGRLAIGLALFREAARGWPSLDDPVPYITYFDNAIVKFGIGSANAATASMTSRWVRAAGAIALTVTP